RTLHIDHHVQSRLIKLKVLPYLVPGLLPQNVIKEALPDDLTGGRASYKSITRQSLVTRDNA
ncbi:MAG: hypothetical protein DSM106950_42030, partial [Stigonema ocellatum SAG 48.90 = DSM 106950]|nr:hypothetical protein [Stigonema ocellatum SAG 48.90 = DSM 106950]